MKEKQKVAATKAWREVVRGFSIDRVPKDHRRRLFDTCLEFLDSIRNHKTETPGVFSQTTDVSALSQSPVTDEPVPDGVLTTA